MANCSACRTLVKPFVMKPNPADASLMGDVLRSAVSAQLAVLVITLSSSASTFFPTTTDLQRIFSLSPTSCSASECSPTANLVCALSEYEPSFRSVPGY